MDDFKLSNDNNNFETEFDLGGFSKDKKQKDKKPKRKKITLRLIQSF